MRMSCFLLLLLLLPLANSRIVDLEEEYGENLVRVQREAQIDWIRENKYAIRDYFSRKNRLVSSLTNDQITEILRNEKSREMMGINEINLTPYMEKVRSLGKAEKKRELEKVQSRKKARKGRPPKSEKVECIRKIHRTFHDPIWRINIWSSTVSDRYLEKILDIKTFEGC